MTIYRRLSAVPRGRYAVILADAPSRFKTRSFAGTAASPDRHYFTMPDEEIAAMPIAELAAKDCALFFWWTWPKIFAAEAIMEAWGFQYSGLAWEWRKWNPRTGKAAFGGGYGTRKNLEPCLLGRRGSPKRLSRSERDWIDDWIDAPRREHSRKPDEQYDRIERMYVGPRLELFARQARPGWDQFGNEVEKFTARPAAGRAA